MKKYKTRGGGIVGNLTYIPLNQVGCLVTFPVKGTVKEEGHRSRCQIWDEDGKASIFGEHSDDIESFNIDDILSPERRHVRRIIARAISVEV
jgi:hypothetical protein